MIGLKLAIDFGERFQSVLLADTPDLMPLSGSYPPPPQRLSSAERISDIAPSLAGDEAALGVVAQDRDELCAIVGLGAQALVRDDDRRPRQCGRRDAVEHFCKARGNPLTVRAPQAFGMNRDEREPATNAYLDRGKHLAQHEFDHDGLDLTPKPIER